MQPQITTAAAPGGLPPSSPPVTAEAHVVTCLAHRERVLDMLRFLDRQIMAALSVMDERDGDCDLEPSLGWCGGMPGQYGSSDDIEQDDVDREPSLGAPERAPSMRTLMREASLWWGPSIHRTREASQTNWAVGRGACEEEDIETEDAGGGDVNDQPHDGEDDFEPMLGALENVDQTEWSAGAGGSEPEGDDSDLEADLGWPLSTPRCTPIPAIVTDKPISN